MARRFGYCTEEETQILLHDPGVPPRGGRMAVRRSDDPYHLLLPAAGEPPSAGGIVPGQIWWIDPSTAQSRPETLSGVR